MTHFPGKTSVITTGRRCELSLDVPQYTYPAEEASLEGGQVVNKAIFLDVDGVLNNGNWAMEMYEQGVRVYHDDLLYEPSLVQLKRIVDTTGAVIVVSSSWRQVPTAYLHLREWLEKFGMEIYDNTPYVGGERGDDITAWFNRHPGDWKYVVLDDDGDMGVHITHLV